MLKWQQICHKQIQQREPICTTDVWREAEFFKPDWTIYILEWNEHKWHCLQDLNIDCRWEVDVVTVTLTIG